MDPVRRPPCWRRGDDFSGRHCRLGFAASTQLPARVRPLARTRSGGLAGYSPELPRPREAHQLLQLYGTKDTTKSLQTLPLVAMSEPTAGQMTPPSREVPAGPSQPRGRSRMNPSRPPLQRPIAPERIYPNLIGPRHPLSLPRNDPGLELAWLADRSVARPLSRGASPGPFQRRLSPPPHVKDEVAQPVTVASRRLRSRPA